MPVRGVYYAVALFARASSFAWADFFTSEIALLLAAVSERLKKSATRVFSRMGKNLRYYSIREKKYWWGVGYEQRD